MKVLKPYTIFLCTALLLNACAEGIETGGGAGDVSEQETSIALITPLIGIYDLPDNWAGLPLNEAYIEIQAPESTGDATSLVHRLDAMENCFEPRPSSGQVFIEPISNRVFFDSFDFGDAELSRVGNQLLIELTEDFRDIDNDGNVVETAELRAIQLDISPMDLNTCS